MRQVSIFLIIFIIILAVEIPTFSAIKGQIDYSIPTDYSKISESEIESQAKNYYFNALRVKDGIVNDDITKALFFYNILEKINPTNINYPIKLGILYDKINKDRHAKGFLGKAMGIDPNNPEVYFYYGEFYYKRKYYVIALKYYKNSYNKGFNTNYDLLYKLGDIYEKLGDTQSSLKYFTEANQQNPNPELEYRIDQVRIQDSVNKEFYADPRIRKFSN